MPNMWRPDQITWLGVVDVDGLSDGDIVTIELGTPVGKLQIMAEIDIEGRRLTAKGAHIQSEGGPRSVGLANLYVVAQFVLDRIECDEAIVEGAVRTTGARPGHYPRAFRFRRKRPDQAGR